MTNAVHTRMCPTVLQVVSPVSPLSIAPRYLLSLQILWISVSNDLRIDAVRDLNDVDGESDDIHVHPKVPLACARHGLPSQSASAETLTAVVAQMLIGTFHWCFA